MDLLETRELRYFVEVAERLHFGRAADALRIAQPALTRSVQRLERRLGVELLRRTSRAVELTPAGAALLERGRIALAAVGDAARSAIRAAEGEHLRLLIKAGGDVTLLSRILAVHAGTPDARPVDVLFSSESNRAADVRSGRADAALVHLPIEDVTGLTVQILHTEDRVAVLGGGHPLAERTSLRLTDLAREPQVRWRRALEPREGVEAADLGELIALVRLGRGVAVIPRSLIPDPPADIRLVPVLEAGPSHIAIAYRADERRSGVLAFVAAAVSLTTASRLERD